MGVNTAATLNNSLVTTYTGACAFALLQSTAAAAAFGTELAGGSPAYARIAPAWSAPSGGSSSHTSTFNVPSGATVASLAYSSAATAGVFQDSAALTSQTFSSQGTYQATGTRTQT